jgi:ribosomal protein L18E
MPNIPVIEKPSNLEANLPVPPRKPRNVMWKHIVKKLKLSEATRPEVNTPTRVVKYCQ